MPSTVRFRLDPQAVAGLGALRSRLRAAGLPTATGTPDVVAAAAGTIGRPARDALAAELRTVALPALWLATLGSVTGDDDALVLAAVTDPEVLAVHTAVHDALAGRARGAHAAHLPGSWLPHVVLATGRPAEAFALLHPAEPVRARIVAVELHDTRSGETEVLAS
ncbi:2'-5' RNA ligase family protein [Pseudonocardia sp. C8]|uniref:2'-5' RNA ligase family protein n=1 Tax=Pseudonocardia sp. C8 TaxID=2762759 RepID=UPI001642E5FE|nr:2'-5' RNA ligase family protein [Pseudonocardia sp. C8]MBC3194827.1 2'-5' RNA ligase family protein [Pseudonocardia sp. C8]